MHSSPHIPQRKRLRSKIRTKSIVLVEASEGVLANGDAFYPYIPNSDLLWLTGIAQEGTFYVLVSRDDQQADEYLFIKRPNPQKEIWEGRHLTAQEARDISGIEHILYSDTFDEVVQGLMHQVDTIYLPTNENDRKPSSIYWGWNFVQKIKKQYPLHHYERLAPILKDLRMVKQPYEIERIQRAIEITNQTFRDLLPLLTPDMYEYDIHAEVLRSFKKQYNSSPAFPPIIASGDRARILHYTTNAEQCRDGEMVLIDFGATYASYHSDITRCVPISGVFSKRQREVYNACLHLNRYAMSILKPGAYLAEYTHTVAKEATNIFAQLGLLTKADLQQDNPNQPTAYQRFLYHGISHHLGLDVHDLSDRHQPLAEGMVLTVEPGIYIEAEGLGVRLENDVLITASGCQNLSKDIPIEIEDIERLMKK